MAAAPAAAKDSPQLPIAQCALFSSGVGYFQREAEIEGNARVDLTFPVSDINDLLKSMVLQDLGGGRVAAVSYESHDPIDKTLRSFATTYWPQLRCENSNRRGDERQYPVRSALAASPEPSRTTSPVIGSAVDSARQQSIVITVTKSQPTAIRDVRNIVDEAARTGKLRHPYALRPPNEEAKPPGPPARTLTLGEPEWRPRSTGNAR